MPSQVFYRKWRPQRLDQVVGQEPVTRTLKQAILNGRVAHAYLFCGPRGTGKTSSARILAKAVNCLQPEHGEPCNGCAICESVSEGRALDLIEIDAASHRGIDDIRNLRDKVHFAPNEARFKVYIIDEVHMLTTEAFNALLKTLEEPPEHAIFVLATTEAHRVPVTIASRCQRFDFKRITQEDIVGRLGTICQEEGINAAPEVLAALSRLSSGSLRDAENLLEQLAVSYGPLITLNEVQNLFGLEADEKALDLVEHVLKGDVRGGLAVIGEMASQGGDLKQMHRGVLDFLRSVMLLKSGSAASIIHPEDTMARMTSLSQSASMDRVLKAVRAFAQLSIKLDGSSPVGLELALVESALDQPETSASNRAGRKADEVPREAGSQRNLSQPTPAANDRPSERMGEGVESPARSTQAARTPAPSSMEGNTTKATPGASAGGGGLSEQWNRLLKVLHRKRGKRFEIAGLLRSCKSYAIDGERLILKYSHRSHVERMKEEWEDPPTRRFVRDAVEQVMGFPYELVVEVENGQNGGPTRPLAQSHLVNAAMKMGATISEEREEDVE